MNVSKTATFTAPVINQKNQDLLSEIVPAIRWLETLTNSPAVPWNEAQRTHAKMAVDAAREALATLLIV